MKLLKLLLVLVIAENLSIIKTYASENKIVFEENKTQWPSQVKYKVGIGNATSLFMEKNKFTYVKYNASQLEDIHEQSHKESNKNQFKTGFINVHAFSMEFINSNLLTEIKSENKQPFYHNYFIGKNSANWASNVGIYEKVVYTNLYPNINLVAYQQGDNFKYDFIVAKNGNPALIQMQFTGADDLFIDNNKLIIKTSVGDVIENTPFTYQLINGVKKEVKCFYTLSTDKKTVTFNLPEGYDKDYELIIDPVLVGSTFSGTLSSTQTFGHSATYDQAGNIYTGGECFSVGYPTTLGAYQTNYAGNIDMAISKLTPNASNLIWATYIGGSDNMEIPNSLYVGNNGDLYILGATGSATFPTTFGAYDNSFNGASDIVVTRVCSNGNSLVGSTFVGGGDYDGSGLGSLGMNMHDAMRGEIIVDAQGNAWIASFSNSNNFPTTAGAYDQTHNGGNTFDACVFRLSSHLSHLQWSTFVGGTNDDVAYGLRLSASKELFVTGFTNSNNFPVTAGAYDQSFNGGKSDGFIIKFNTTGSSINASTFLGTTQDDISYFLDLDNNENPHVYGCSNGSMPVTAGVYSNPGSGNFVSKFNNNLSSLSFSTVFGDGSSYYLEPEAFMVDTCGNIYLSGFHANSSYPVTANALYPVQPTFMDNCYFLVLTTNATSLLYGTFYFGSHVDGGTSRFDSKGTIYQGICIGGGATATTTPWAWDTNINMASWDMLVVKIAFQFSGITASATANPNTTVCLGSAVNFNNTSTNALNYIWNFGDGSANSTAASPSHTYTNDGTYNVTLVAIDSFGCVFSDTTHLTIKVLPLPIVNLGTDITTCEKPNLVLNAGNSGSSYLWSTGAITQTINVIASGTYWVTVSNGTCSDSDTIVVQQLSIAPIFGNDITLCAGQSTVLNVTTPGATSYAWNTGAASQSINVNTTGQYWVSVMVNGCNKKDTINVNFIAYPLVSLGRDVTLCPNDQITLDAGAGATSYLWNTGSNSQTITVNQAGTYSVSVFNQQCESKDQITVSYVEPLNIEKPTSLCTVNSFTLDAGVDADSYIWSTGETSSKIEVGQEGEYWVTATIKGCELKDTVSLEGYLGQGIIYLPNTFTPNGNGLNDNFMVKGVDVTYYEMTIFNRWGQQVFSSSDKNIGWDGTFKGEFVSNDVYVWKLKYKTACTKDQLNEKIGHVTVLR